MYTYVYTCMYEYTQEVIAQYPIPVKAGLYKPLWLRLEHNRVDQDLNLPGLPRIPQNE